jgi:hypothetical protein
MLKSNGKQLCKSMLYQLAVMLDCNCPVCRIDSMHAAAKAGTYDSAVPEPVKQSAVAVWRNIATAKFRMSISLGNHNKLFMERLSAETNSTESNVVAHVQLPHPTNFIPRFNSAAEKTGEGYRDIRQEFLTQPVLMFMALMDGERAQLGLYSQLTPVEFAIRMRAAELATKGGYSYSSLPIWALL